MLPIRKVLHPTDFSGPSRPAFELACALARDYDAELLVVHVVTPPRVYAPDGIAMPFPVEEPYEAHANLARLRPADARVRVDHKVLEGETAEQILKAADDFAADVIVMGTHGATGLTRLLVGSVAESVMRKAPCPVLTIRGEFRPAPEQPASSPTTAAPR